MTDWSELGYHGPRNRDRPPAAKSIGEIVLRIRTERAISATQLCKRAGLSRPHLSKIERGGGDVFVSTLLKLADALGVHPMDLIP